MWSDPVRYTNDQTSPTKRNTFAIVPTAKDLKALAQPSLPDQEAMQLVHDMWCHPGNDKMEQIYQAKHGRGFPRGFITKLRKFHCTCAVSKRTRRYRRSKRVKLAAAKRATQAGTLQTRKPSSDTDLNDFANAEHVGNLKESHRCHSSSNFQPPTAEPARRVLQRAEASTALHQISAWASAATSTTASDLPALR